MAIGSHPGRSGWWRRAGHPLPEMPKTTVRAGSGDPARSFGDADALGPLPSPAAAVWWEGGATGGDCCSMTNRVFIIPFEGEHVHALRSRERGCFLVVQNSMGGKNSVNNRCRIAKHFRPK